ncbi:MAG: transposase [Eubacteriaceae bacterium]|jgi:putative transposase|nr:transposase [Eubacteriaceae bacterium]
MPKAATLTKSKVILADPFFPSSKTCCNCGAVYGGLKLSQREWGCKSCGAHHHRDVNAAKRLEKIALEKLEAS